MPNDNLSVVKTVNQYPAQRILLESIAAGLTTILEARMAREQAAAESQKAEREWQIAQRQMDLEQQRNDILAEKGQKADRSTIDKLEHEIQKLENEKTGKGERDYKGELELDQKLRRKGALQESVFADIDNLASRLMDQDPAGADLVDEKSVRLKSAVYDLIERDAFTPDTYQQAKYQIFYNTTPQALEQDIKGRKTTAEQQRFESLKGPSPVGEAIQGIGLNLRRQPAVQALESLGNLFKGRNLTPEERVRKAKEQGMAVPSVYDTLKSGR